MPKTYPVRNAFNAGEVSPLVDFRDDVQKYSSACLTLENAVPLVEGGAKKMPGTYFAGPTALSGAGKSRLAPFQFSTAQGAILEFSAGLIRIWEGASQGSWSLGLAVQVPAELPYETNTSYIAGDVVLVGPFIEQQFPAGKLFIGSPYGFTNIYGVGLSWSVNSIDSLVVSVIGASPNQYIHILLANATPSNNSAGFIQAGINTLVSLNAGTSNYVDLTQFTVTPDLTYYTTPSLVVPTGYSVGNVSSIAQCILNNRYYEFPLLADVSGNVSFNATYWEQFGAVEPPIELTTPYLEQDLFALDLGTQSADVLWIFHPNYPPAVVERLSANSWAYSLSLPGQKPGQAPYRGTLDVVKTGYSALGQSITAITAANPCVVTVATTTYTFAAGSRVYINLVAGMVELNQGEFLVASPVQNANGTFSFSLVDPDTGTPVNSSGFIAYTSGGFVAQVVPMFSTPGTYPACGTLYQERLCVGGALNTPTQMNGSVQDDYPDFISDPNAEDYAIQFTLVSNKLDQILNMVGTPNALLIGTAGGAWVMVGSNGSSLSQTNVDAAKQSNIGVSPLQPQLVNDAAIFVSRSTRIVTFLTFDFVTDQWSPIDLTRLNRSITLGPTQAQSGIIQTAFQQEPYPIFWAVRNDGQLLGLVFNKQDQVYAWFRINMPGGLVESVAVISGANQEDQVAIVVNRTVNGATVRYVEYFMPQELFHQLSNAYFVQGGQQLKGLPAAAITGITNSSPTIVTAPAHGFSNGMQVMISGVQGMTQINQDATEAYTIAGVAANTFQLVGMDSTGFGVYSGGGQAIQVFNQVTGLSYLIGQTVTAVGDGALILQPTLVTGDAINLPYYANLITIGIPYGVTIQPTNPVLASHGSTTRGMSQKIDSVTLSLYESMGGQFGTDLDNMYDITYGTGQRSQQPSMSTGEYVRDTDGDWNREATFYVTQSDPFPFTLRGIVFSLNANQD